MLLLNRLHSRDRALYEVLVLPHDTPLRWRAIFTTITHVGGGRATVAAALAPFALADSLFQLGVHATLTLVLSHLLVQFAKRLVHRDRPSRCGIGRVFVVEPDRFSFPSGHATASMAVALAYAVAFPAYALPLIGLATAIGISRVALGMHYPGDVAAGQALAVLTHYVLAYFGT